MPNPVAPEARLFIIPPTDGIPGLGGIVGAAGAVGAGLAVAASIAFFLASGSLPANIMPDNVPVRNVAIGIINSKNF